jgi:hypothetical protein
MCYDPYKTETIRSPWWTGRFSAYIGAVTRSTRHISRRPARPCSTTLSIPTIVLSLGPTAAQKQDLIAYLQTLSRRGQADGSG